jgi:hypothetical protein
MRHARPHLAALTCALALVSASCSQGGGGSAAPASGSPSGSARESAGIDRSALPPGHEPTGAAPGAAEDAAPHGALISWSTPAGWRQEPPSSGMRFAQFRVSGVDGDPEDAECAVFYFGPGQGGSPKDNATRWIGQFRQPDGGSSEERAKIGVQSVNGKQVMFVEVAGDYSLIGAIVSGPDAPWFFKLTGPRRTVEANRGAFSELIASIH